jgi:hypothetical protein
LLIFLDIDLSTCKAIKNEADSYLGGATYLLPVQSWIFFTHSTSSWENQLEDWEELGEAQLLWVETRLTKTFLLFNKALMWCESAPAISHQHHVQDLRKNLKFQKFHGFFWVFKKIGHNLRALSWFTQLAKNALHKALIHFIKKSILPYSLPK